MVEVIRHFTVDDLDDGGRQLVGSNTVYNVSYYDSTEEAWPAFFTTPTNPIINPNFADTTITGTGPFDAPGPGWYETGPDGLIQTGGRHLINFGALPYNYPDEVYAAHGTVLSGSVGGTGSFLNAYGDWFIDASAYPSPPRNVFPDNYIGAWDSNSNWVTITGTLGTRTHYVVLELDEPKEIAGLFVDHYHGDDTLVNETTLGDWSTWYLDVASSGTGSDAEEDTFTTVASGTNPIGWNNTIWETFTPALAKFIRVRWRNHGWFDGNGAARSTLAKIFFYEQEVVDQGTSVAAFTVPNSNTGATRNFALNQDVNFDDLQYLYVDFKTYARSYADQLNIRINASERLTIGNTGGNDEFIDVKGFGIDVRDVNFATLSMAKTFEDQGTDAEFIQFTNFRTVPEWWDEPFSEARGSRKEFPPEALFVSDERGLSIVDITPIPGDADIIPRLWMRFNISPYKMLELRPTAVAAADGRVYIGTTRGLYVLDFAANCCLRFDSTGLWARYSIADRDVNGHESARRYVAPRRAIHSYHKVSTAPVPPGLTIFDLAVGSDNFGSTFVIMGTDKGLVHMATFDNNVDSNTVFYQSADKSPVRKVAVAQDGSVWYIQDRKTASVLNYAIGPDSITSDDFEPDETYHQSPDLNTTLSGSLDNDGWEIVNHDPDMTFKWGDSYATVSGTHSRSGATGIITKKFLANQSFTAKLKVRIKDFPPDARGGLRFGFFHDYLGEGLHSLLSIDDQDQRRGFCLSALNVDSYPGDIFGSAAFDSRFADDDRGWHSYVAQKDGDTVSTNTVTPTEDGYRTTAYLSTSFTGDEHLVRLVSGRPFAKRDFVARVKAKPFGGFDVPITSSQSRNASAFFGISSHPTIIPGATGTTRYIDAAMAIFGDTVTTSGTFRYAASAWATNGYPIIGVTLDEGLSFGPLDGTGIETTPYREWGIDYNAASGTLNTYLDGTFCRAQETDDVSQPPTQGLILGVYATNDDFVPTHVTRDILFKELDVEYPTLVSGSQYKYSVEVAATGKGIDNLLVPHNVTYSGLALAGDTFPASGTLQAAPLLTNGTFDTSLPVVSGTSMGVGFEETTTIEALWFYDGRPDTTGWNNTGLEKTLEVWTSDGGVLWDHYRNYDLNQQYRVDGITKLSFAPALETRFVKARTANNAGNYNVAGNSAWGASEIEPITVSGIDFGVLDATPSADFVEWQLVYDAGASTVVGYIDGIKVAQASTPDDLDLGHLLFLHDQTPASSGVDNLFQVDFKDFEVQFQGYNYLASGPVTGLAVNANLVSGGYNYTVMTASSSGTKVVDIDTTNVLPTLVRDFPHDPHLFGASPNIGALVANEASQRDSGIMLLGSSDRSVPQFDLRLRKPYWHARYAEYTGGTSLKYGGNLTFTYDPGSDRAILINNRNAHDMMSIDLDRQRWSQVSRLGWRESGALHGSYWQLSAAQAAYVAETDTIWFLFSNGRLVSVATDTGDAEIKLLPTNVVTGEETGDYAVAYAAHAHSVFYTDIRYIYGWDVVNNEVLINPRNYTSTNYRLNNRAAHPWNSGSEGGMQTASYCDYDHKVYMFGAATGGTTIIQHFYRYDVERNSLEQLISGYWAGVNVPWPITDEEVETLVAPAWIGQAKAAHVIYDPINVRVYIITGWGVESKIIYYDPIEEKFVDPGEPPPYIHLRNWPSTVPGSWDISGSNSTYNYKNHSILLFGRTDDPEIYEYYLPKDLFGFKFEYIPRRDGIPSTASGTARQFTQGGSPVRAEYNSNVEWESDFYYSNSAYSTPGVSKEVQNNIVTFSGGTGSRSDEQYYWHSRQIMDPNSDFDVSMKIALPKMTQNIYYESNINVDPHVDGRALFAMGLQDGLTPGWTTFTSVVGDPDPQTFQHAQFVVGVSGVQGNAVTEYPIVAHVNYHDAWQRSWLQTGEQKQSLFTYDTYKNGGVTLSGAYSEPIEARIQYTRETREFEAFFDGTSVGKTTLKRNFDEDTQVRVNFGLWQCMGGFASVDHQFVAEMGDIKVTTKAWDRVQDGRLVSSISGTMGSYYHYRTDITLLSGVDWVYDTDTYLPTSRHFPGYAYVATLGGMADAHKLVELAALVGPGQRKYVGFTTNPDRRDLFSSYGGLVLHSWDDFDLSKYTISKNTANQTVSLFLEGDTSPSSIVDYQSLPDSIEQHAYYGKVAYGSERESFYGPTAVSGSWTTVPNFTSSFDPGPGRSRWKNDTEFALWATAAQLSTALAEYTLDEGLGDVDLYTFYLASGYDAAKNTPHFIHSDAVLSLPGPIGEGNTIFSVTTGLDESEQFVSGVTQVRVDQRRDFQGTGTSTNKYKHQGSGWVWLGRYRNPSKVVVSANASAGTTTAIPFVCAGAIGVDVDWRGKSTFDMSVGYVRYQTGHSDLREPPFEPAGITVLDFEDNVQIDQYGRNTAPKLIDGSITSGEVLLPISDLAVIQPILTPDEIFGASNISMWFDSREGLSFIDDGGQDKVTAWANQGTGGNISTHTVATRPNYNAVGAAGTPELDFDDAGSDILAFTDPVPDEITLWIFMRAASDTVTNVLWTSDAGDFGLFLAGQQTDRPALYNGAWYNASPTSRANAGWHVTRFSARHNGTGVSSVAVDRAADSTFSMGWTPEEFSASWQYFSRNFSGQHLKGEVKFVLAVNEYIDNSDSRTSALLRYIKSIYPSLVTY